MTTQYGELLHEFPKLKNGKIMRVYKDGNQVYFTMNDVLEQTVHVDDIADIMAMMMGAVAGK
jgi:hypothetical protein